MFLATLTHVFCWRFARKNLHSQDLSSLNHQDFNKQTNENVNVVATACPHMVAVNNLTLESLPQLWSLRLQARADDVATTFLFVFTGLGDGAVAPNDVVCVHQSTHVGDTRKSIFKQIQVGRSRANWRRGVLLLRRLEGDCVPFRVGLL